MKKYIIKLADLDYREVPKSETYERAGNIMWERRDMIYSVLSVQSIMDELNEVLKRLSKLEELEMLSKEICIVTQNKKFAGYVSLPEPSELRDIFYTASGERKLDILITVNTVKSETERLMRALEILGK